MSSDAKQDGEDAADWLGGRLERWLAEQRVADAADERRREGWLRRLAAEQGTMAGVLVDLAERERPVVLHVHPGRRCRGTIRTVGRDFVGLGTEGCERVLLATRAISSVRPEPSTPASVGHRAVHVATSLADVLQTLAGDQPHVAVTTLDGGAVTGSLRSVGDDVLVVKPDGGEGVVYVCLAQVAGITVR
ncbi:MAG: hypothetical protein JWM05_2403 [Acidimicrobiales bacterium]|nr:hypothetical protein [Acidimicrobiales bacterium]